MQGRGSQLRDSVVGQGRAGSFPWRYVAFSWTARLSCCGSLSQDGPLTIQHDEWQHGWVDLGLGPGGCINGLTVCLPPQVGSLVGKRTIRFYEALC